MSARDSSISNDEAADSSVPDRSGQPADGAPSHRYSTRASDTESNTRSQRAQRRIASNVDDHNRDDSDDSNDASSGGPTVRRQSQRTQADRPETSSRRNSGRRSGKTLAASTRGRKVLKAVSTTAHRQRRRGFAVSTRLGTTSEEDQEHQRIELVLADDLDNDDVDDDEEGNGRPARMRSVSIAGVSTFP